MVGNGDIQYERGDTNRMAQRNIFYSWQTDNDPQLNRSFIENCLKKAIRNLNREDLSDLVIDRDTKNVPGMPDIGSTILEKISKSVVVVADLTLINPAIVRRPNERAVSNPNVLFEFGYAFGVLGPKSMIGVFNLASGEIEELPFDLRPKRLMTYRLTIGEPKDKVKAKLISSLSTAIKQCIGDTEDEHIRRNSQIIRTLSETWMFGTEIEEWHGIKNLSEIIQNHLNTAQVLPDLMRKNSYSDDILGNMYYIISSLEIANTLTLNDENWPKIKENISSAANTIDLILHFHRFKMDQNYHDNLVRRVAAMPSELDEHLENLENDKFQRKELEILAHELRTMAFKSLVPQNPQFDSGLKEISIDLRRHVLRCAKNTPKKEDAISSVRDIRERLAKLIDMYSSLDQT